MQSAVRGIGATVAFRGSQEPRAGSFESYGVDANIGATSGSRGAIPPRIASMVHSTPMARRAHQRAWNQRHAQRGRASTPRRNANVFV